MDRTEAKPSSPGEDGSGPRRRPTNPQDPTPRVTLSTGGCDTAPLRAHRRTADPSHSGRPEPWRVGARRRVRVPTRHNHPHGPRTTSQPVRTRSPTRAPRPTTAPPTRDDTTEGRHLSPLHLKKGQSKPPHHPHRFLRNAKGRGRAVGQTPLRSRQTSAGTRPSRDGGAPHTAVLKSMEGNSPLNSGRRSCDRLLWGSVPTLHTPADGPDLVGSTGEDTCNTGITLLLRVPDPLVRVN